VEVIILNFILTYFYFSLYRIYSSWRLQERTVYTGTATKNGCPYHPLALLDAGTKLC